MDRATMLWANASLTPVIAILMLAIWAHERKLSSLGIWAAAMVLQAGAAVLFALRHSLPEAWAIIGGNSLALLSCGLQWSAVRAVSGQRIDLRFALPALLWLLACAVPAFYASFPARVVLVSVLIAAIDVAILRAFWSLPVVVQSVRRLGIILFGLRGLIYAARAGIVLLEPALLGGSLGIPDWGLRGPIEVLIVHSFMIHPAATSLVLLALAKSQAEHALHRAEQQRLLLLGELKHRIKNILSMVQAMALQTARRSDGDLHRFSRDYGERLRALARAHDLLTYSAWEPVPALHAVEAALTPWMPSGQIIIEGAPDATLAPGPGQMLVLALHELATNAAKYGALSTPEGRVMVTLWCHHHENGNTDLRLDWQEVRGPPISAAPTRKGFGRQLLEQGLVHQSGGAVEMEFHPAGLLCRISLPLGQHRVADSTEVHRLAAQ